MFPLRDDNPQIKTPVATYTIVLLNVAAWVLLQGMGAEPTLSASVCQFGLIPGDLLQVISGATPVGLNEGRFCVVSDGSLWHTMLTSMFMHGSWMHIIGNMWFLWIFGGNVEDSMGPGRFTVFYLLCGLAAAGLQMAANPASDIPMVGASGAIGGVMGAYVLLYPRVHVHLFMYITTIAVPAWVMLGYWFGVQIFSGVATFGSTEGGVAFWAHIGGFVAGALLVMLFKRQALLDQHPYHGWRQKAAPTRNWHRVTRRRR